MTLFDTEVVMRSVNVGGDNGSEITIVFFCISLELPEGGGNGSNTVLESKLQHSHTELEQTETLMNRLTQRRTRFIVSIKRFA